MAIKITATKANLIRAKDRLVSRIGFDLLTASARCCWELMSRVQRAKPYKEMDQLLNKFTKVSAPSPWAVRAFKTLPPPCQRTPRITYRSIMGDGGIFTIKNVPGLKHGFSDTDAADDIWQTQPIPPSHHELAMSKMRFTV